MKIKLVLTFLILFVSSLSDAKDLVYQGKWTTTNRKLDGEMTCVVTSTGGQKWQGRFSGTWQGVDFQYKVDFNGPADELFGTAAIDGAAYEWRARITPRQFKANFGGDRYVGSFDLSRSSSASASERSSK